jgi:hypothetical protein
MGDPQTLNLYSYVENNPITGTDPDGHADGMNNDGGCARDCDRAQDDRAAIDLTKVYMASHTAFYF